MSVDQKDIFCNFFARKRVFRGYVYLKSSDYAYLMNVADILYLASKYSGYRVLKVYLHFFNKRS